MEVAPGVRVGWLEVLSYSHKDEYSRKFWRCKCRCGKFTTVRESDIKLRHTRSCGCMRGWNYVKKYQG